MSVAVLHERNPLFTRLSDGGVRNDYTMRFLNKRPVDRTFDLTIEGAPAGAVVKAAGVEPEADGSLKVVVGPDQTRQVRVSVTVPKDSLPKGPAEIGFRGVDPESGETSLAREHFIPN
jgi:polyferredoxin